MSSFWQCRQNAIPVIVKRLNSRQFRLVTPRHSEDLERASPIRRIKLRVEVRHDSAAGLCIGCRTITGRSGHEHLIKSDIVTSCSESTRVVDFHYISLHLAAAAKPDVEASWVRRLS